MSVNVSSRCFVAIVRRGGGWNLSFVNFVGFYFRSWSIMTGNSPRALFRSCRWILPGNSRKCVLGKSESPTFSRSDRVKQEVFFYFSATNSRNGNCPSFFLANFSKLLSRICAWPCYFVGKFFPLFIIYMYDIQWIFLNNNLSFFFTLDTLLINFLRNWFYEIKKFFCEAKLDVHIMFETCLQKEKNLSDIRNLEKDFN